MSTSTPTRRAPSRSPSLLQKLTRKFSRSHSRSTSNPITTSAGSTPERNNAPTTTASQQARAAALRERGLLPPLPLSVQEAHQDSRLAIVTSPEPPVEDSATAASQIKQEWEAKNRVQLSLDPLEEVDTPVEDITSVSFDTPSLFFDSSTAESVSTMALSSESYGSAGNVRVWDGSEDGIEVISEEGGEQKTEIERPSSRARRAGFIPGFKRTHKAAASLPNPPSSFSPRQHQRTFSGGVNPTMHTTGSIMSQTSNIEDEESRRMTEVAFM